MKEITMPISEFKARCLRLLEEVASNGHTLIVTKRGKPLARVSALAKPKPLWGRDAKISRIKGDLVNFHDDWPKDSY